MRRNAKKSDASFVIGEEELPGRSSLIDEDVSLSIKTDRACDVEGCSPAAAGAGAPLSTAGPPPQPIPPRPQGRRAGTSTRTPVPNSITSPHLAFDDFDLDDGELTYPVKDPGSALAADDSRLAEPLPPVRVEEEPAAEREIPGCGEPEGILDRRRRVMAMAALGVIAVAVVVISVAGSGGETVGGDEARVERRAARQSSDEARVEPRLLRPAQTPVRAELRAKRRAESLAERLEQVRVARPPKRHESPRAQPAETEPVAVEAAPVVEETYEPHAPAPVAVAPASGLAPVAPAPVTSGGAVAGEEFGP